MLNFDEVWYDLNSTSYDFEALNAVFVPLDERGQPKPATQKLNVPLKGDVLPGRSIDLNDTFYVDPLNGSQAFGVKVKGYGGYGKQQHFGFLHDMYLEEGEELTTMLCDDNGNEVWGIKLIGIGGEQVRITYIEKGLKAHALRFKFCGQAEQAQNKGKAAQFDVQVQGGTMPVLKITNTSENIAGDMGRFRVQSQMRGEEGQTRGNAQERFGQSLFEAASEAAQAAFLSSAFVGATKGKICDGDGNCSILVDPPRISLVNHADYGFEPAFGKAGKFIVVYVRPVDVMGNCIKQSQVQDGQMKITLKASPKRQTRWGFKEIIGGIPSVVTGC